MLRYVDTKVTFQEVPDEITLCINISGCPIRCPDCHSKYLWDSIGKPLGYFNLVKLIKENEGITCVSFMGGDDNFTWVAALAFKVRREFPELKIAWYSGKEELPKSIPLHHFDYIKLGPYIKEKGGLDNPNTNQKMYRIYTYDINGIKTTTMENITNKFWKDGKEN